MRRTSSTTSATDRPSTTGQAAAGGAERAGPGVRPDRLGGGGEAVDRRRARPPGPRPGRRRPRPRVAGEGRLGAGTGAHLRPANTSAGARQPHVRRTWDQWDGPRFGPEPYRVVGRGWAAPGGAGAGHHLPRRGHGQDEPPRLEGRARRERRSGRRMVDSRGPLAQDGRRAERLELRVPTTADPAAGGPRRWPVTSRCGWTTTSTRSRTCAWPSTRPAPRCAQIAAGDAPLTVIFETTRAGLHIEAWVPTAEGTEVPRDGFGWAILATLVDAVEARRSTQAEVPAGDGSDDPGRPHRDGQVPARSAAGRRPGAMPARTSRWPGEPVAGHRRDARRAEVRVPDQRSGRTGSSGGRHRPVDTAVRRPDVRRGRRGRARRRRRRRTPVAADAVEADAVASPTRRRSRTTGAAPSAPRRCSPSWRRWRRTTRAASGCGRSWSRSTCPWSGTSPAGSATAASPSTTCCRSARSA